MKPLLLTQASTDFHIDVSIFRAVWTVELIANTILFAAEKPKKIKLNEREIRLKKFEKNL